jgi:signal transduction histidine kinase
MRVEAMSQSLSQALIQAQEQRYVAMQQRLERVNTAGALLISVLTAASLFKRVGDLTVAVGGQLVLLVFNAWLTYSVLRKVGLKKVETFRAIVNVSGTVMICHFSHWPLAAWLWLPFVALAFDVLQGRVRWSMLFTIIVVTDVTALLDGVPWPYPFIFTSFALSCAQISAARFRVIREMLVESDEHRVELATVHEDNLRAHEKLKQEIKARVKTEALTRDMAREAGRAEMAAGVLHNVGNALNGFTVLSGLLSDRARSSKAGRLHETVELLARWDEEHGAALKNDPKGQKIIAYLARLADEWRDESETLLARSQDLQRTVQHMAAVVAKQQYYAKPGHFPEACNPAELMHDAVMLSSSTRAGQRIDVEEHYRPSPTVMLDRHRVLQIVLNLIRNAEDAVTARGDDRMRIFVYACHENGRLRISVQDNGVGVSAEAMAKLFTYGFTTKPEGHGFGLHNSKLLARELGGALSCRSDGEGQGATFTLELPATPVQVAA